MKHTEIPIPLQHRILLQSGLALLAVMAGLGTFWICRDPGPAAPFIIAAVLLTCGTFHLQPSGTAVPKRCCWRWMAPLCGSSYETGFAGCPLAMWFRSTSQTSLRCTPGSGCAVWHFFIFGFCPIVRAEIKIFTAGPTCGKEKTRC